MWYYMSRTGRNPYKSFLFTAMSCGCFLLIHRLLECCQNDQWFAFQLNLVCNIFFSLLTRSFVCWMMSHILPILNLLAWSHTNQLFFDHRWAQIVLLVGVFVGDVKHAHDYSSSPSSSVVSNILCGCVDCTHKYCLIRQQKWKNFLSCHAEAIKKYFVIKCFYFYHEQYKSK